ncbi:MAG: MerR family transcriptional regulator, partial [Arthrobacter sp.]|uniref:MerR family transcriptional regulator n=1 Tax=Arthrobacter sp. TaxID=1667 RepID=UPI0034950A97
GTRRYSQNDVDRLRRIGELVDAGVNLAGVAIILRLESDYRRLDRDLRAARGPRRGTPEKTPRPDMPSPGPPIRR